MMSRADYEASICKHLHRATSIPFREVKLRDKSPDFGCCHRNVDKWVEAHPEMTALRGWVTYASFGSATGLTAHSVVQDGEGNLFDITPLQKEELRKGMRFIQHVGDEQLFSAMKALGNCFNCPDEAL